MKDSINVNHAEYEIQTYKIQKIKHIYRERDRLNPWYTIMNIIQENTFKILKKNSLIRNFTEIAY